MIFCMRCIFKAQSVYLHQPSKVMQLSQRIRLKLLDDLIQSILDVTPLRWRCFWITWLNKSWMLDHISNSTSGWLELINSGWYTIAFGSLMANTSHLIPNNSPDYPVHYGQLDILTTTIFTTNDKWFYSSTIITSMHTVMFLHIKTTINEIIHKH